jgi:hypothetical protein
MHTWMRIGKIIAIESNVKFYAFADDMVLVLPDIENLQKAFNRLILMFYVLCNASFV